MKKTTFLMLTAATALTLCTGAQAKVPMQDITLESLYEQTTPENILKKHSIFSSSTTYENSGDSLLDASSTTTCYRKDGDLCEVGENMTFSDGYSQDTYFSNDPEDKNYYIKSGDDSQVMEQDEDYTSLLLNNSLLGDAESSTELTGVEDQGDVYVATLEEKGENSVKSIITIDAQTGEIQKIVSEYASMKAEGTTICTLEFDYSETQIFNDNAKTDTKGSEKNTGVEADGRLYFNTTDINGEPVSSEIIKQAKLVLVNYWEPWCGSCVAEMPDLQKLYEEYKDKGLLVLGVYSAFEYQQDAEDIVKDTGVAYPILKCDDNLKQYQKSFFPATYFADGEGNILTDEAIAAAKSFKEWEELVQQYLE